MMLPTSYLFQCYYPLPIIRNLPRSDTAPTQISVPGDRPGYHGAIATLLNILGHLVECSANDCVALSKVFRYLAESDTLVAMCIIRSYFKEHQYNTQYFSF